MYRTRIQAFIQHENELKDKNRKLREMISNTESSSHDTVAKNLRRFDQYKVRIITIIIRIFLFC